MQSFTQDPKALGDLCALAVEVAARPERWSALCDLIADQHDATAFMLYTYDPRHTAAPAFLGSRACWEELAPMRADLENGHDQGDSVAYHYVARAAPGEILSEAEFLGLPTGTPLPVNLYRQRVLDASGAAARFAFKFNDVGPFLDLAAFHTRGEGSAVHAALRRATPLLYRVLAKSLETSRTIAALTESYARLCDLFERLDFAVAFCDVDGGVVQSNARFRELAADGNVVVLSAGRIRGKTADENARIAECIADALNGQSAPGALSMALTRRDGLGEFVLRALPMRESQIDRAGPIALVALLDPHDEARLNAEGLLAFDVLSSAEAEVCRFLIQGSSTVSIAQRRDTTIDTVRKQIKSAQSKLSCRTRLDVQRLALLTSVPVDCPSEKNDAAR